MYRLTAYELELTRAKLDKINARAAKRGFTGRLELEVEQVTETTTNALGFTVTEVFYRVSIEGEAPKYNGWTLLAALDFDPDAGLIVRTAPGIESVDRSMVKEGHCAHCQQARRRVKSYLVRSDAGQVLQVGSTCLKDFLGWSGSVSFLSPADMSDDMDEIMSMGGGWRTYSVESVLAAAWVAIKAHGFVRTSDYVGTPTRDTVGMILSPGSSKENELVRRDYEPFLADALPMANEIKAFVLSDAFSGDSEYVRNLKALCAPEYVSAKYLGIMVSAPQAMAKAQERTLIKKREANEIVNEHVGAVGDKLERNVKITAVRWIASDYGSTTLYTMTDDKGYVFKWFASRDALGEEPTDDFQMIRGTVKAHDVFNGQKSTVLTRVKALS